MLSECMRLILSMVFIMATVELVVELVFFNFSAIF